MDEQRGRQKPLYCLPVDRRSGLPQYPARFSKTSYLFLKTKIQVIANPDPHST